MRHQISRNKQLKIGALLSYAGIGVNIVSALIYSPWMLSQIGASDYGLYTLATSLINMFLLDFGISSAVSRFVSKYLAEGRQDRVDELLGMVYKLFLAITLLISIVLVAIYFFIDQIYLALTPAELERFQVVYVISAVYSVFSFPLSTTLNGILNSYEKFIQMKACDVVGKVVTVLCIVFSLLLGNGLYELVAINAVVNLVVFGVKVIIIKRTTDVRIKLSYWNADMLKEVLGFSIWVLINSICSRLIMNICPNILGVTVGTAAITVFSFASTIEGYSYTFSSAIDGMFMPQIARITYGEGNIKKVLPLMIRVGRFQYNLVGLILVGFTCVGEEFIHLWIGSQYHEVYYCALLLLLPAPFYLSQQIGKNTMVITNNIRYLTYVNVVKAILNVILVSVLSCVWGVIGACLSICIVYLFRNLANMYMYRKKLGLDMRKFSYECYARMSLVMTITMILGLLWKNFSNTETWMDLGIKVMIISCIYFGLMWKFAYKDTEKSFVLSTLRRVTKRTRSI